MKLIKIKNFNLLYPFLFLFLLLAVGFYTQNYLFKENQIDKPDLKLYWFIPDGLRSEDELFKIYEWAENGELPNIKKLMEMGSYGYSIPTYPGHSPTNFATLLTGTNPYSHMVFDGPMRREGYSIEIIPISGFTSYSKNEPPIWLTLEKRGESIALLSLPGSTPPDSDKSIVIRGRWGAWGFDTPAVIFHSSSDVAFKNFLGYDSKLFYFSSDLTKFINYTYLNENDYLKYNITSYNQPFEIKFENWDSIIYGFVYDSTNDSRINYDRILISRDKKEILFNLKVGDWSDWIDVKLSREMKNDYNINTLNSPAFERSLSKIDIETKLKINVIKLNSSNEFRIRFYYNNLNPLLVQPSYLSEDIINNVGPMVDYVDNYPQQLNFFEEDKKTFIDESLMSYDWHKKMVKYLINQTNSSVIIHDIYTPNQILTSKWWMGYINPINKNYHLINDSQRELIWKELKLNYIKIDEIIGEILKYSNNDTIIVFSSDHGVVSYDTSVSLNSLFAKKGWLSYYFDDNGNFKIDWKNSKVVFLKTNHIYINPNGLDSLFKRQDSKEYYELRDEVISELENLEISSNNNFLENIVKYEDANDYGLPTKHIGDLILIMNENYGLVENINENYSIFTSAVRTGEKQAINPRTNKGMWTPFIISGPGIKKNYSISVNIDHIDQYPTIFKALNQRIENNIEGRVIEEIFENEN